MAPQGPWCLTSILPDGRAKKARTVTRTFDFDQVHEVSQWITRSNEQRNIYFHVNPTIGDLSSKASKSDIAEVTHLHVDIDPQGKAPLAEERAHCLALITTERPNSIPEPTVVVDSGGGYQAFWRLEVAIPIGGHKTAWAEAERYNKQLEKLLEGDNCFNVDRLMRLPGTVNWPDSNKIKKGRVPAMAKMVGHTQANIYSLKRFQQITSLKVKGVDSNFTGSTIYPQCAVSIDSNVDRLGDIDELEEWNVTDRIKTICVQGHHPERAEQMKKSKDTSRSAWLFDVVCNLVRAEVPDTVIYSVITDPDFAISASVLDKGGSAHQYAINQIEKAKETSVDPVLREMNEQHAVIANLGGKCRIVEHIQDPFLNRHRITMQSFADLSNRYMNVQVPCGKDSKGNQQFMQKGKWWLHHAQRRQYTTMVFAPEQNVKDGYNLWQGFAVDDREGDCSILMDHMLRNICQGNEEYFDYLMNWLARAVQKPWCPGEVAVVLRGAMGTGKSMLAKLFGRLWGNHYMVVSNSQHLVGNFNGHLRDVCFLFADEAFFAGDPRQKSVLRSLITDEQIAVESKGVDTETARNCLHIMMASNDHHVVPAGEDERRFFFLDVGNDNHQDSQFFNSLAKQMDNGGYEGLLHMLRNRDISKFNPRNVPKTDALQEQKMLSLTAEQNWWYDRLQEGLVLPYHEDWETEVPTADIRKNYVQTAREWGGRNHGTATKLGKVLKEIIPDLKTRQKRCHTMEYQGDGMYKPGPLKRQQHYCLPSLDICRKAWDDKFGPQKWALVDDFESETESGFDEEMGF